jgi:DNA-directed RNA polymerase subunit M/transcription elongation factor TFIIS
MVKETERLGFLVADVELTCFGDNIVDVGFYVNCCPIMTSTVMDAELPIPNGENQDAVGMSTDVLTNDDDPRKAMQGFIMNRANLPQAAAIDLEKGVYNWAVEYSKAKGVVRNWKNNKFRVVYLAKLRSVMANVSSDSYVGNVRLGARMLEGEFQPRDIAFMKPENVFPEVWKTVIDLKLMRDQFSEKPEAMTDQFRCGRCKKRECVYQELQLRSSDEPMSLFITCLNCGNRWRMG